MFKELLKYASKDKKYPIVVATIVFLLTLPIVFFTRTPKGGDWWADWGDPIVGLATFFVALGIWLASISKAWKEQLPKRLTVKFFLGEQLVMVCNEAYLASESDIRTWGQQIGAQMSGTKFLKFFPYIKQSAPVVKKDPKDGTYYNFYEAVFYLKELPKPNLDIATSIKKEIEKQLATSVITWNPGQEYEELILDSKDQELLPLIDRNMDNSTSLSNYQK